MIKIKYLIKICYLWLFIEEIEEIVKNINQNFQQFQQFQQSKNMNKNMVTKQFQCKTYVL